MEQLSLELSRSITDNASPNVDPAHWINALEWTRYAPTQAEAQAWAGAMSTLDGVLASRTLPVDKKFYKRRSRLGYKYPHWRCWWMAQIYVADGDLSDYLSDGRLRIYGPENEPAYRAKIIGANDYEVIQRRPIPPGFFTALRYRAEPRRAD